MEGLKGSKGAPGLFGLDGPDGFQGYKVFLQKKNGIEIFCILHILKVL